MRKTALDQCTQIHTKRYERTVEKWLPRRDRKENNALLIVITFASEMKWTIMNLVVLII